MNIEHISVSRHGVFHECEEKYNHKYHMKTPVTTPEPIYFAYGKMVHKIAEDFVESKDPKQWEKIVTDVITGKVEIEDGKYAPKLDREYSNKLPEHLRTLHQFIMNIGIDTEGYTEYHFKYDLSPPNEYMVTGFIDRIVVKNGKYFIFDYKTTKKGPWRKNKNTVKTDLQLRLYAQVVRRTFNVDPSNIYCSLYYLEGGDLIGTSYPAAALDDAERELLETYLRIKDLPSEKARGWVGDHCKRCDYRKQCRFYSLT